MKRFRIALTGDVALELIASYFRDAGYEVMPAEVTLEVFRPDFVYDVTSAEAALASEVEGFYDARFEKLSGCRFSRAGIRAIVDEFAWFALSRAAKVLAVDADNTLWRGIVSEDGWDGVTPYRDFQTGLKRLRDEGVVLVLLSKNDSFDDPQARPPVDMGLFSVRKVNWSPKAGNLIEACRELNLSPDAVVFVDDNPHERAQMAAHLPEVCVAPWNGFPTEDNRRAEAQLLRRLKTYFFSAVGGTAEDRLRGADYAAQSARTAAACAYADHDAYLDSLELHVTPAKATAADLDRLVQMAGKTNQFNATTIRRTRDSFEPLVDAGRVFVFRAGDRFGEQGLVCYIVVDPAARRITDFVMSCRAMGRTLEHFAYRYVADAIGYDPEIDFVPTAKNRPFAEFLRTLADLQPDSRPTRWRIEP